MHTFPPVVLPPPPPTSNTLSSHERSALVRSSRKLYQILGEVPRMSDDQLPLIPSRPSTPSPLELTRTVTRTSDAPGPDAKSIWRKRKPTHLAPLLKFSSGTIDVPDSPASVTSPVYHRPPMHHELGPVPLTASGASTSDTPSDFSQRRARLERLRRKLGDEVPATSVFPTTPLTAVPHTPRASTSSKRSPHARTRSVAAPQPDDARSIAFSISSDESVHAVTFTTRVHSPRPSKTKHVYHTGALPPVPSIPAHFLEDDDAGLVRTRLKMAAGSKIGGSDFKAARRAKREGNSKNGNAEPGELVEMVGFMR